MTYQYIASNAQGEVVKGKLAAADEKAATELLDFAGYQVINLKPHVAFFDLKKLSDSMYKVTVPEIALLYRQLAMLLESGINIGAAVEMLRESATNPLLKKTLGEVVSDIRGGNQFSASLEKHPKIFTPAYCQLLSVGEQSGGLELLLRQVAEYMEKETKIAKETKGALKMPAIISVVATLAIGFMITFVLPSVGEFYEQLGSELPGAAKLLINLGVAIKANGLVVLLGLAVVIAALMFYIRTPGGRYQLDRLLLKLPLLGRVRLLTELSRFCRSMSLLFHAGMPLSEVMPLVIKGVDNKVIADALVEVQKDMVKGEGLSGPMAKNKLFLSMMVQMVKVGEETGSLDVTLQAVAQSYETEAEDKIHSMIELIEPAMMIGIGGIIGLVVVTMVSAMTGMAGGM